MGADHVLSMGARHAGRICRPKTTETALASAASSKHRTSAVRMWIYAAMAQKERELISERTRAALAAAKARGKVLGGDRAYRPAAGPDAAAAALARHEAAEQAAHRLALEVERLRAEGVTGQAALARALTECGVSTPRGGTVWTHTTVTRVPARAG
jgi:DNA invertase Pin-like site-specific DNA recombinase